MLLLKNCRLVKELTENYDGEYANILIDGKIIKEIKSIDWEQENVEQVIDMENKTVIPGLFDLHMHFNFTSNDILANRDRSESQLLIDSINYAKSYLRNGYTTTRECGIMYNGGVYLRGIFESGLILGPRVITSGPCNTPTAAGNEVYGKLYRVYDDPSEAMKVARDDISAGADFVKYMVTGAIINPGGDPGAMITTYEEIKAISDAAKSLGTYVAVHCHGKKGIMACIEAEVGTIEHCTFIDDECVDALFKHGNVTAIVPTLTLLYSLTRNLNGDVPEFWQSKACTMIESVSKNMHRAYRSGVRMGWGSDADKPTFDANPGLEFRARKEIGFSNIEMLKQATIDSASILGLEDKVGTIKVGKYADLVVISGKPDENIEAMYKLPEYVFKEGELCTY